MKTAQEAAFGEHGVDTIKRIFEELSSWDQQKVIEMLQNHFTDNGDDLASILSCYPDFEILNSISLNNIVEYITDSAATEEVLDTLSPEELIDYLEMSWPDALNSYVEERAEELGYVEL